LTDLDIAADIVLTDDEANNRQKLTNAVACTGSGIGLAINTEETKCMAVGRKTSS